MKKELNLATVLVCIVFVFLFCNIPRVFVNCYEFLSSEEVIRWADIWFGFLCSHRGFKILVDYYTWNMSVRAFYLKAKLIDRGVTPPSTFSKKVIGWKSVNKPQPFSDYYFVNQIFATYFFIKIHLVNSSAPSFVWLLGIGLFEYSQQIENWLPSFTLISLVK